MGLSLLDISLMVHQIKGNVLEQGFGIVAHGCNCKGGFGAGVALAVAKKHPEARNAYLMKFNTEGWRLGDVQFVMGRDGHLIANCATQKDYMPRGKRHVDYDAVRACMEKVRDYAKEHNLSVACPKIGAGLAGGDWSIIKGILKEVFVDYDITVFYLE